jgi:transketolase
MTSQARAFEHHTASPQPVVTTREMANALRALAMDAVEQARSGHPGMPMGMADVATVLFARFLTFDPSAPDWPDRDRFVLSAGHGSMLLYALLHLTGYEEMTLEQLKHFRQLGARTAGHPELGHAAGIETTTGPLGQGISNAVGMALAERMLACRHGRALVDHFTYAIASDGDLMEGISHEACSLAGHLGLGRLIVLFDDNGISIDGPTSLACSDDVLGRFEAYGWQALRIDGHDVEAIAGAIEAAQADPRPSLIACRTVIGFGAPNKEGTAATHGAPLGEAEVLAARGRLGWPYPPFVIPDALRDAWRAAGERGAEMRLAWERRLEAAKPSMRSYFTRAQVGELPARWQDALSAFKEQLAAERPAWATRKASEETLKVLTRAIPDLVGGSADLTGSNNTRTESTPALTASDMKGRYVHYGVREHAMAAIMNGIALHRGLIPYGGTFLIFSDYCRPAIRLSALMRQRVVYVFTHDSIGLGEDGPTHQPVEQLASLRAMPTLFVFRPADAIETAECWALAIEREGGPSALALTRQNLPTVRSKTAAENLSARGAYVLAEANAPRALTLLATGSEVHLALEAQSRLQAEGVPVAVVSMPCFELFELQDRDYRAEVLGSAPRLAIEAASPFGWTRYVASEDDVVGMTTFGASGPYEALYEHFGITAEAIVERVRARLGRSEAA